MQNKKRFIIKSLILGTFVLSFGLAEANQTLNLWLANNTHSTLDYQGSSSADYIINSPARILPGQVVPIQISISSNTNPLISTNLTYTDAKNPQNKLVESIFDLPCTYSGNGSSLTSSGNYSSTLLGEGAICSKGSLLQISDANIALYSA